MRLPFVHARWYRDYKCLVHECLYCRNCGAVYDTIGSLLGLIKLLLNRVPSKIIAVYKCSEIKLITSIGNSEFRGLFSMPPFVIRAMIEDDRIAEEELVELEQEPTVDLLVDCCSNDNHIVKREAIIALRKFNCEKRAEETLIRALADTHWDVRRNAAITLGEIGSMKAIEPLREIVETEVWEHLVRDAAKSALVRIHQKREQSTD